MEDGVNKDDARELLDALAPMSRHVDRKIEFLFELDFRPDLKDHLLRALHKWSPEMKKPWWFWRRWVKESEEVMRDLSVDLGFDVWVDGVLHYKDGIQIKRVFTESDWDTESVYRKLDSTQQDNLRSRCFIRE